MKIFALLFFAISFCFFDLKNANAYLDPGTGSIFLQTLIGGIAASTATIFLYWSKLKDFLFAAKKNVRAELDGVRFRRFAGGPGPAFASFDGVHFIC